MEKTKKLAKMKLTVICPACLQVRHSSRIAGYYICSKCARREKNNYDKRTTDSFNVV